MQRKKYVKLACCWYVNSNFITLCKQRKAQHCPEEDRLLQGWPRAFTHL